MAGVDIVKEFYRLFKLGDKAYVELRDREKTTRNFKKQDTPLPKGLQIYHNYFREHEGLEGKTPAEMAGIKIEGINKWVTVIQNASRAEN